MMFRSAGRELAVMPTPRLVVNDVDTGCDAAVMGLGICQPPSYYVEPYLTARRLVPVLERFAPAPWTLYLCYPGRKHLPARVRAFVEFAQAELGGARGGLGLV
jgi:DNA-binding transcriptional LysR family regulator